ncbi:MAG TPA: carboxypeptidase-like regulatory domain-containing protein [Chitinophagaceae bacterium]|nr:carboxypeptidase-like regulatory domain-containing protein [Chitinophagaceae bacterium]
MRKDTLLILPLCLLLLLHYSGYSQETPATKIDDNFDNVSATEFLNRLEKKTSYRFYYNAVQLDTLIVQLNVKGLTLEEVLQEAFKKTDILFSIDSSDRNVFVSKKNSVVTELPQGLFPGTFNQVPKNTEMSEPIADYEAESAKVTRETSGKLVVIGRKGIRTKGNAIVTGYIRNANTGEPLTNVSVFTDSLHATLTDAYGHFSLSMPVGNHVLSVQTIGMRDVRLQVTVHSDGKLDVDMNEQIRTLKEVVISSRKTANIRNIQMGVEKLTISTIRNVPTVFGESDILRVITSLPGVKTVGEASTGFNVRGGSADQNLILFNDATIYNPSHFFGVFSAFNPEVIKGIELYKSSVPANYGGRLSSVLEITSREGNKKEFTGSAGLGLVTSRIHLEGPLAKDKTSFILGARTTYANWLLDLLPDEYENSNANFQDIDFSISHLIDSSDHLYFNGYFSNDKFSLVDDTTYGYSNRNVNIKWKHNFTNKFTGVFLTGYDQYIYDVVSENNKVNAFKLGFDIKQLFLKANFDYYINSKHSFDFGLGTLRYKLNPGYFIPLDEESQVIPESVEAEQALESSAYLTHRFSLNPDLSFSTGIRYSMFNYLGPQEVSTYTPGAPVTESNRTGSIKYAAGKFIKTYDDPEFRISVRYILAPSFSIKASYNSLRQYIHLLSNTTLMAPTDIWKLSDPNIRPQQGEQISLGFYKNFKSNTIETSLEIYYKKIKDYLDYKPGATLFLNQNIETDVINTKGKAYGLELLLKKPGGKLNGWFSYTYSRILLRGYDTTQGVIINNGKFYPANYDKPHDATLTANFRINHRFSISFNSTYSTGRPITLPIGRYYYAGSQRVLYSDRNAYRIPDYYRTDFAMNIEGNHKVNQKTHNSWTVGVYNLLGRKNPYSVYFVSENGRVNGYKLSIFGSAIPFVNFNIRF